MVKDNHHLFTMLEVRKALIKILGEPKTDADHNRLHQEMRWAWKRMPKYKIDKDKHRAIHLPYKRGIKPSKELIALRTTEKEKVEYKEMFDKFVGVVDREAMEFNIKPEQYSYSMVENFIKFLKEKKIILAKEKDVQMALSGRVREGMSAAAISLGNYERTIPSCEEEAIELYGYDPKTKKYPKDFPFEEKEKK